MAQKKTSEQAKYALRYCMKKIPQLKVRKGNHALFSVGGVFVGALSVGQTQEGYIRCIDAYGDFVFRFGGQSLEYGKFIEWYGLSKVELGPAFDQKLDAVVSQIRSTFDQMRTLDECYRYVLDVNRLGDIRWINSCFQASVWLNRRAEAVEFYDMATRYEHNRRHLSEYEHAILHAIRQIFSEYVEVGWESAKEIQFEIARDFMLTNKLHDVCGYKPVPRDRSLTIGWCREIDPSNNPSEG